MVILAHACNMFTFIRPTLWILLVLYKLLALSTGGHYMNNMIIFHILFDTAIACLMNFVVWAIYETQYGSLDEKIHVNVESVVTVVSTMAWQRCGSVGTLFSISVVARSTLLSRLFIQPEQLVWGTVNDINEALSFYTGTTRNCMSVVKCTS